MNTFEEVRRSVAAEFDSRNSSVSEQEGIQDLVLPGVAVSGSQPAWLSWHWRAGVTIAALVMSIGALILMVLVMRRGGDAVGLAIGLSGSFAIVALVLAFLTVAGFGQVTFSLSPAAVGADRPPKKPAGGQQPVVGNPQAVDDAAQ